MTSSVSRLLHRLRGRPILTLLFLAIACAAPAAPIPVFRGVTIETEKRDAPRPLRLYWLEADLTTPGVKLEFSAPDAKAPAHFNAVLPTTLLARNKWQAVINGDAFAIAMPNEPAKKYPNVGDPLTTQGLGVYHGRAYHAAPTRNEYGFFYEKKGGKFGIGNPPAPAGIINATGGYRVVVREGEVVPNKRDALHPRTVVGLDKTGKKLIWLIVDGRQPGISEGALEQELGDWMLARGAWSALSLDGGGSSILAIAEDGKPHTLNQPVGLFNLPGTERPVGSCLGLKAPPLAPGK